MFDNYLTRGQLIADGDAIATRASRFLPARQSGVPAMLKVVADAARQEYVRLTQWVLGLGRAFGGMAYCRRDLSRNRI